MPTTIIDATLQPNLLAPIWPKMKVNKLAQLAAPHRHIRQVTDRAFSLSMLDADAVGIEQKERRRRANGVKRLHLTITKEIRRVAPGRVLVVAQKRIRAKLEALGDLGSRVDWAHHFAVAGRDEWRDVRLVIVIGRTLPPPAAVERMAEALTGAPVEKLPPGSWYPRRDATYLMSGGRLVAAETDYHPDPIAEAFRWRACEGELIQIIERARGVNRTSDAERVDVLLLTDVPLPMPIDELISADDVAPRIEDQMLAAGGVVYDNAEAAAAAYPWLWPNGNALRVARHRERERHHRTWAPPDGLVTVEYRRDASGAHHDVAYVDASVVACPIATVTGVLGAMDYCAVASLPAPETISLVGTVTGRSTENRQPAADGLAASCSWQVAQAAGASFTDCVPDG